MKSSDAEREAIETAAAEWLARRDRQFTAEEAVAFARWRMADSRHEAAVRELEGVWHALDGLLAAKSKHRAGGAAASPPARSTASPEPRRAHGKRARWWPVLGLAATLAIAGGAWRWSSAPAEPVHYETRIGVQRSLQLPDGSQIQLNTNSAVRVQFDDRVRLVALDRGEAFFHVAKEAKRPFVVRAGLAEVQAIGTAFGVRLREQGSEIVVAEGRVRFGRRGEDNPTLERGQLGRVGEGAAVPRIEHLDAAALAARLAWQTGWLECRDTPLREVVAELNRYHRQRLVLQDEATGDVRVGGPFALANLEGVVNALESSFDVAVVRRDENQIVLGLRP